MDVTGPDERIEAYLDELLLALRGRAARARRILAETEAHLRDAVQDGTDRGLEPADAVQQAIERFGPPRTVARRFPSDRRSSVTVARELARALVLVAGIGLVAIGASGVLSMGMRAALGSRFVAGDLPGVTYTRSRCADFTKFHPEARTCEAAASAHHADEVEQYRGGAGMLGAIVLAGWWWRRRHHPHDSLSTLPQGFTAAVGTAVFGLAAAALLVEGLNALAQGGARHGPGQWFSGGVVSLAVAGAFAWALLRSLQQPVPAPST